MPTPHVEASTFTSAQQLREHYRATSERLRAVYVISTTPSQSATEQFRDYAPSSVAPPVFLRNPENLTKRAPLSIHAIKSSVARHYGITVADIEGIRRDNSLVFPRFVAMWLCVTLLGVGPAKVGRSFGGRDHTTVTNAVQRTRDRLRTDKAWQAAAALILSTLGVRYGR